MQDEKLMTLAEIADGLNYSTFHTAKLAREGRLPVFKIGHTYRMTRDTYRQFVGDLQSKAIAKVQS
jgi:excisionase family DNA binding protein